MKPSSSAFSTRRLAATGLLAALVFIFSWIQIPIGQVARIHLGNVFCALAGLLFGPLTGGLAGGFGSMLFDLTNPAYIAECWITFITKFFIGFLAGLIAGRGGPGRPGRDLVGAAAGSAAYVALYLFKSLCKMLIEGQQAGAIRAQLWAKGATSLINAALAVAASVLLAQALRPALRRAGLLPPQGEKKG